MSNEKSHPEQERIFRLEISGGFLLLLSFTAFLCGGGNVFAAAIAAAFHELGHLALILLQGSLPRRLTLDVSGACLRCYGPEPSANQELLRAMWQMSAAQSRLRLHTIRSSPSSIMVLFPVSIMFCMVQKLAMESP